MSTVTRDGNLLRSDYCAPDEEDHLPIAGAVHWVRHHGRSWPFWPATGAGARAPQIVPETPPIWIDRSQLLAIA
jgi:hypothetical protein